jgi:nicotinate phosphoribosyltransferase
MQAPFFAGERTGTQGDFYLLVLAAVYHADGLWGEATFDLYARSLPKGARYLVAGGIEEAVDSALSLRFSTEELDWLRGLPTFQRASEGWWDSLESLRFGGDIHAVPEGSVVFPNEPLIRVTAPLVQATLVHTRLLQAVQSATGIATQASRLVHAAGGRRCFDFSSRSMPGQEAGLRAARASAVGGFVGTSNTLAAHELDLAPMGTLSDEFMAVYGSAGPALEAFSVHFPDVGFVNLPAGKLSNSVAQLSPYSDLIRIVRLDHSSLGKAAPRVRRSLDLAGMDHTRILGTGSLDLRRIEALGDAPIDLLGIGKALTRAMHSAPMSYRVAEIWRGPDPEPCDSPGAAVWPGMKQVWRYADHDEVAHVDEDEHYDRGGQPLLQQVVREGERLLPRATIAECNERREADLASIGEAMDGWEVRPSARLTGEEPEA